MRKHKAIIFFIVPSKNTFLLIIIPGKSMKFLSNLDGRCEIQLKRSMMMVKPLKCFINLHR